MPRSSYICRFRLDGTQSKSHEFVQLNSLGYVAGSDGLWIERAIPTMRAGLYEYLTPYSHAAVLALHNDGGSGVVLNLERVEVFPMSPPNAGAAGTVGPRFSIYRGDSITATGGQALDIAKIDSASPDVPAEVQVLGGAQLSLGAAGVVRQFVVPFSTSFTPAGAPARVAVMLAPYRGIIGSSRSLAQGELFDCGLGDASLQSLTLKPGEEFGVVMNSGSYYLYSAAALSCMFATGTDEYVVSTIVNPSLPPEYSPLAILNGSAQDIRIKRIGLQELCDTDYPFWTLTFVDGLEGGEDAEVSKLDSANRDLPPGVSVRRNVTVLRPGGKRGASAGGINIREILHSNVGIWPTSAPFVNDKFYNFGRYASFSGRLALREGQGIALVQRNQSGLGLFEVYFRFSISSAREAQGGSVYVS